MPSHRIHKALDRLVFGEEFKDVHRFLDSLSFIGGRHRKYPPHDILSLLLYTRDPRKLISGYLHILLDSLEKSGKQKFNVKS